MYRKTFECLCRETISRLYTILNTVHAMLDIITHINFKTFDEYLRELECGQTDRQTDRQTECLNIFQLCWKGLKKRVRKFQHLCAVSVDFYFFCYKFCTSKSFFCSLSRCAQN